MNFISIHISEKWGQDTTGLKYWRCACQNMEEFRTPEERKEYTRMCWTQKQIRCSGFCKWLLSLWCSLALCWVGISWILLEFWERKSKMGGSAPLIWPQTSTIHTTSDMQLTKKVCIRFIAFQNANRKTYFNSRCSNHLLCLHEKVKWLLQSWRD